MTHSFLINSSIPASFRLDALSAAVYTINRLPTPFLHEKLPYEVLFAKVPDYKFLKPFGYACFPHLLFVTKLSSRSVVCMFLGYAPHFEAVAVLILLKTVFISVIIFFFMKMIFLTLLLFLRLHPLPLLPLFGSVTF